MAQVTNSTGGRKPGKACRDKLSKNTRLVTSHTTPVKGRVSARARVAA